jgi:dTDP-D-glucose 4,6-dehydratase
VLSLGVEFCKNNNIKDFKFVYLFCDKVEKVIAIKFLREQAEGSYKISTLKNFKNPKIVSSIALQYMDLKSKEKKSIKIIPEKIEDKNLGTLFLLKI